MFALSQPFYHSSDVEEEYRNTINTYTHEQAEKFPELLALLIAGLEEKYQDFLGQVFSMLNLGNAKKGQFFTPYHISKLMAEISIGNVDNLLSDRELITLSEPCSGSGGIIIAYAELLKEKGYNYQHQLFVEAIDIDEMCFMMTYIQLALYGIPARVMLGDTLAWKFQKILYTPLYFINFFEYKLKKLEDKPKQDISIVNNIQITMPAQLSLF